MKPFIQFLREDLSAEFYEVLEPYDDFPPEEHLPAEEELYNDIQFLDFPHYMKTQIAVVSKYIASQGIGNDPAKITQALNDAFMQPEIQQSFRLHYARKFPEKVVEK